MIAKLNEVGQGQAVVEMGGPFLEHVNPEKAKKRPENRIFSGSTNVANTSESEDANAYPLPH